MAENPLSFLKDILFTPASIRGQNNEARLLQQQSATSGANMSAIAQEIMGIRAANPNIQPNQLILQLTKNPKFVDALSGSDESWKQAMEIIKQTQAPPAPEPVKVGQYDTLQVPGANGQFEVIGRGAGVDNMGNQAVSTDKIRNFEYFSKGLPPEEQDALRAAQLSDDPSAKEATIARLRKLGWTDENAIKFAEGVVKQVTTTDKLTGATKVLWLDQSDPANPQVFELPEQPMQAPGATTPAAAAPGSGMASPSPQQASLGDGTIPAYGVTLLNAIAGTESPGYDVMNGGQRFTDMSRHPLAKGQAAKGGTTSASGRYQFVRGTWERAAKALGLKDFSPASQDRAAWWLAQQDYKANTGRSLDADLQSGNVEAVRRGLSSTWRGLADNPKKFNAAMGKTGGTTGAENFQPGAAGLSQAEDINGGRPSGRRLAEAFLTVGPLGTGSRLLETGSQILDPSAATPEGTQANEDLTMRAQLANNIRAMQADLGRGNNVSQFEAKQFDETIAKIEGATSAQAALANVKQVIANAEQSRVAAERILKDPTQSLEERKNAQQRLNIFNERLAQLPTLQDIDATLAEVRSGKSGASTVGGLIKQGQATLDSAVPVAKGIAGQVEDIAAPLVESTGLDPNAVPKMTIQQLLKVQENLRANGQDFRDLPPEQQQSIKARIEQLRGGGK